MERARGIEPTSEARRPSPEPRADSMALHLVRSKNKNKVRPEAPVAGLIARLPLPSSATSPGKDPALPAGNWKEDVHDALPPQ